MFLNIPLIIILIGKQYRWKNNRMPGLSKGWKINVFQPIWIQTEVMRHNLSNRFRNYILSLYFLTV